MYNYKVKNESNMVRIKKKGEYWYIKDLNKKIF